MRELNTHRFADIFPQMTNDEWEAFLADIDANGVQVPLVLYQGDILDGRHRYQAAQTLFERKGADIPFDTLDFEGEESDALRFVYSVNMHRRHLTTGQRACIGVEIKRNLQETIKQGQRTDLTSSEFRGSCGGKEAAEMAAEIVSVGKSAIYITEKIAEHAADLYEEMRAGNLSVHAAENKLAVRQGTQTPRQAAAAIAKEIVATVGAENVTQAQVEKVAKVLASETANIHVSDESYEWYTPPEILDRVRAVYAGCIDLDPASCEPANRTVQAKRFFTREEDGLAQEWRGKVFLNPPYCMPDVEAFCNKLLHELEARRVEEAILLLNNSTDTAYFHRLLGALPDYGGLVCFLKGRVKFTNPNTETIQARQGQALFYYGVDAWGFRREFSSLGTCLELRP